MPTPPEHSFFSLRKCFRSLALAIALGTGTTAAASGYETYYSMDLNSPAIRSALEAQGGTIVNDEGGQPVLKLSVGENGQPATKSIRIPISGRGVEILAEATLRADNVRDVVRNYNGLKFQITYLSAEGNRTHQDAANFRGTTEWTEVGAIAYIPQDAVSATLMLGLEDCVGTGYFKDVSIRVRSTAPRENVTPRQPHELTKQQTQMRGVMSPNRFSAGDFSDLAAWNANAIRWQLLKPNNSQPYDVWLKDKLDELAQVLDAAAANGIGVVIDMHSPIGGRLPDGTMRIVLDKADQEEFICIWKQIATRFKDHAGLWAYDIINEPVQTRPSPEGVYNWYDLQVETAKAIREIDPKTPIMIATDQWNGAQPYKWIAPVDVDNIIYQVHMYYPGSYTHQGLRTDQGIVKDEDLQGRLVNYPGTIEGKHVDKEALRAYLQPVRDFQLAYDVPIFVGEFSTLRWAPGGAQYLEDCISIFEEYGWDWTYHAFREWAGWSVEHENEPYDIHNHTPATSPTDRLQVLLNYFSRNERFSGNQPE